MKQPRFGLRCATLAVIGLLCVTPIVAQQAPDSDVVILDDTSGSMKLNDPQNAIVLVTRLFSDIVPGRLSAVRLLDLTRDGGVLQQKDTGASKPCPDDPSHTCHIVTMPPNAAELVVNQHLLVRDRRSRGDSAFKAELPELLAPSAMDTSYAYSFATIENIFSEDKSPPDTQRVVVWLSDGAPDVSANDWEADQASIKRLTQSGVNLRALVFKGGDSQRLSQIGIPSSLVAGTPSDLMKAFADVFRQIMGAPFAVDGVVSASPKFTIKPKMEEAWVVVYGDDTLSAASVSGVGQTVQCDYASDKYHGSAYRVAYIKDPPAGEWTVNVSGGGPGASYAVIQRSTLHPFVYPTANIVPGVPFNLTASIRSGQLSQDLLPADLPERVVFDAILDGQTVHLNDDGQSGDEKKDDGRYTGQLAVQKSGPFTVMVHAHNSFLDRTIKVDLEAKGFFRYSGGPIQIDFGAIKAGQKVCRDLSFPAEQEGAVPFELRSIAGLPPGLSLELRARNQHTGSGEVPLSLLPQEQKQICLVTERDASSSQSRSQTWAVLAVSGRQDPGSQVELAMTWSVRSLTFWERWGKIILIILGVLLLWYIIYGYIKPYRFPPGLALCYAPAMDELDDQTPQPVKLWRGVGIGFYRDARACLRDDFTINGRIKSAAAILQAGPRRAVMVKAGSRALYREAGYKEWEVVAANGRRASQGEIYRIGETGPYFRISNRMAS